MARKASIEMRFAAWAQERPFALVFPAIAAATVAEDLSELLGVSKSRKGLPRWGDIPDVTAWLRLYRDHWSVRNAVLGLIGIEAKDANLFVAKCRQWDRLTIAERLDLFTQLTPADLEATRNLRNRVWAEVMQELTDETGGNDAERASWMNKVEMQFFMRVWMPCWIEHQEYAPKLFHLARCGDIDALDNLLRLDKSVVGDRCIAAHIQSAAWSNPSRFRRITTAFAGKPRMSLKKGKIKKRLAGWISTIATALGHPLTEPEIRELFDIAASMRGNMIDSGLPPAPEAFAKAIQRERQGWPSFEKVGQKS